MRNSFINGQQKPGDSKFWISPKNRRTMAVLMNGHSFKALISSKMLLREAKTTLAAKYAEETFQEVQAKYRNQNSLRKKQWACGKVPRQDVAYLTYLPPDSAPRTTTDAAVCDINLYSIRKWPLATSATTQVRLLNSTSTLDKSLPTTPLNLCNQQCLSQKWTPGATLTSRFLYATCGKTGCLYSACQGNPSKYN